MALPERIRLTYKRYLQKSGSSMLGSDYEAMFYRRLIWNHDTPGITVSRIYDPLPDVYYFEMFNRHVHVATGYMYREDLEDFMEHGYKILPSNKQPGISFITEATTAKITASTTTAPIAPTAISTTTNTINTTTKKDNTMSIDYDAATIDTMIEKLLQKKAELADIESRWKKDEDFNDGDVIVVEYAYSNDEGAKVYTGALLKTKVGWFTTLTNSLIGANKYSSIVKFFENTCVIKKVTYLALSEGVVMFSNVEDDFGIDDDLPF